VTSLGVGGLRLIEAAAVDTVDSLNEKNSVNDCVKFATDEIEIESFHKKDAEFMVLPPPLRVKHCNSSELHCKDKAIY
jgi:hypothetical protein